MAYEVTATRKRPLDFDGLIGQEFVVSTLRNALVSGRIANAFLFSGPRGVGKTSAARILARALNCPSGPTANGCPDYPGADDIARGRSIDVIEIDGASNTSVNDVRVVKDEILFPPQTGNFKIYIIDEVHMLSNSAFNALLKTIEEPPAYVKFIFATTEIHKVPATIRSRCQQFNFRLISLDLIKEKLSEACQDLTVTANDEALFWIAKEATGSLRDAYTLFDQVVSFAGGTITLEKIREKLGVVGLEQLGLLADCAVRGSAGESLQQLDQILQAGISVEQCIVDCAEYYRCVLFLQLGIRREALLGASPERFSEAIVTGYSRGQIERIIALFLNLYRDVRYSLDPRTELELAIVRLSRMRWSLDSQEIIERFDQIEQHYIRANHTEQLMAPPILVPVPTGPLPRPPNVYAAAPAIGQAASGASSTVIETGGADARLRFLERLKRDQPVIAGLVGDPNQLSLDGNRLTMPFDNSFSAQKAREGLEALTTIAKEIWSQVEAVELIIKPTSAAEGPSPLVDPAVRLATEIFRGQEISTSENGRVEA